jgi:hypothetical protein
VEPIEAIADGNAYRFPIRHVARTEHLVIADVAARCLEGEIPTQPPPCLGPVDIVSQTNVLEHHT